MKQGMDLALVVRILPFGGRYLGFADILVQEVFWSAFSAVDARGQPVKTRALVFGWAYFGRSRFWVETYLPCLQDNIRL